MIEKLYDQGALLLIHPWDSIKTFNILNSVPNVSYATKREDFFLSLFFLVTSHILRYELLKIHIGDEIVLVIGHTLFF